VVTKDVPPYTLAVGNPARVVREIPRDIDLAGRLRIAEEAGPRAGLSR
jgi:acetyltransferase-like isoleucine patch superfamily enzyme